MTFSGLYNIPENDFNIIMILKSLLNDAERESRYREEMETVH